VAAGEVNAPATFGGGYEQGSLMDLFAGVGVALVTLFDESGQLDSKATAALAADLVDRGIQGVLVCGTTGEAGKLSDVERVELIRAVRGAVPAEVPVLAGTGAPTAAAAAELTSAAATAGADAVLAWPPPGSEDLTGYYDAVGMAAGGLPVLAYHIPWLSGPGVPVSALTDLPIVGQKDSSGDPDRLIAELTQYDGLTYVGSSAVLALAGPLGAAGAILAIANAEPELSAAAFAGDAYAQRRLAGTHLAVRAGGPAELKRILARQRGTEAFSRLG
jgi:4-hydroxy-tetrahydrodipicolinate synthase